MANQPHPSKQAVTWRLHRDLVSRVRAAAKERGETVLALVTRALEHEVVGDDIQRPGGAYQQVLDDLDRLRMAAGEDFRMPVDQLADEVARMFGIQQRGYALKDHPDPAVRQAVWHILTGNVEPPRCDE